MLIYKCMKITTAAIEEEEKNGHRDAVNRQELVCERVSSRNFFGVKREQYCKGEFPLAVLLAVSSSIFVSRAAYVRLPGPLKAPRTVKSTDPACFWRKERCTIRGDDNDSPFCRPRSRFFTRSAKEILRRDEK